MQKKHMKAKTRALAARRVLYGTTGLMGMIAQALAQQAAPAASEKVDTIVVTGYRASLDSSTKDKREATGFVDTVSAEDIGKFPDSNIAESLNRIPGVQIVREITGEGLSIQIRGLGQSFTKILLNGAPVAVASTGRTDSQNTNREVDLDLLPTELFKKLTVNKSPTASMLEGGAAGVVDMRMARPYDNPGKYVSGSLQGIYNNVADKWGNRGSIIASQIFDNSVGILGGVAWSQAKVRVSGFETIGWTNANLSATQSTSATRNSTGGGNWTIPGTVPVNAGNGLTTGATIDQAFLLAANPGLSITQIDNAIIPRLGRPMEEFGDKDKVTGVFSVEYRPTGTLQFYLDSTYSKKRNDLERIDMNWVGRFGAMVPLNMKVDRDDCTNGCVVTKGTFANAQYFLEYRPHKENVDLVGVNPGMEWKITDTLKLDAQGNYTKSKFTRESPTVLVITPASSGVTVNFENGGGIPTIATNIDLNRPANFIWDGGRVNLQEERRETETKGIRSNLTWGDKTFNVKGGVAYDDISRQIRSLNNDGAWQAAVCGNNPSVFLLGPNGGPPCNGASTPGASAAALYPGFGTAFTAGNTSALTYQGSLIPLTALQNYLSPGPAGFITVDWDRFSKDSNYGKYRDSAPDNGASNTGAGAGYIKEKTTGFYTEINGDTKALEFPVRYNAGVRWVKTDQIVGGFVSLADPRNAALNLANGARYPNIDNVVKLNTNYTNVLPSATVAVNLARDIVARGSVSRTMTRANPDAMRPNTNFTQPSADTGTVGNPTLNPFLSDNVDLGLEWYTGREGYLSATGFSKKINGFTVQENITVPFSDLAQYGITFDTLTPIQQGSINNRGGPTAATVVLQRQKNAGGRLKITGVELNWVQPLNDLLPIRGFGFSANATFTRQKATGEGTNGFIALGVPKMTNNLTAYYEQHGFMARVSRSFSKGSQVSTANQNGIPLAALFVDDYKQVDFSSSLDLGRFVDWNMAPQLTFDVINVSNAIQRTYFQFTNATFTQYQPNRTFVVGLRVKF